METVETAPEIITLVCSNDINGTKNILISGKGKIDETDENGMSSLQHAAYKGQYEMCKMLLDYGADVNLDLHDHGYSALHFAALSGNVETVKLLLASGAKTYHINTLKRTAAQMAGFVGNRVVVAVINNYVPISDVKYYTTLQGLESVPKLQPEAAEPLYNLIMQTNLHPCYVALSVEKSPVLLKCLSQAASVLSLMCEKEAKRTVSVNEVLCLKFHFLSYIIKTLEKALPKFEESKDQEKTEKDKSLFECLIKKWLIARPSDGFEEHLESFIRGVVKSFPYVEMPLFLQLVRNISSSAPAAQDVATLDVLHGLINGQQGFSGDNLTCSTCGFESPAIKKCSKCKTAQYCDRKCQRLHWHTHKRVCEKYMKQNLKKEEELDKKKVDNENKENVIVDAGNVKTEEAVLKSEADKKSIGVISDQ